jgi:formate dehydrogenase subunit delta
MVRAPTRAYDGRMSSSQYLVHMANDIGNFFRGQHQRDIAIAGIANHMKSFWTRRMREKLLLQLEHGEDGLDEMPLAALRFLAEHPSFKAKHQPGGDAG